MKRELRILYLYPRMFETMLLCEKELDLSEIAEALQFLKYNKQIGKLLSFKISSLFSEFRKMYTVEKLLGFVFRNHLSFFLNIF